MLTAIFQPLIWFPSRRRNFDSVWMMMMMMMMMMIMNCFCGMIDRRKALSLISTLDHCQRSSPSRISDTPRAGFEPAQNLSSDFVEWSCTVVMFFERLGDVFWPIDNTSTDAKMKEALVNPDTWDVFADIDAAEQGSLCKNIDQTLSKDYSEPTLQAPCVWI